jgi:hypothetical protein
MEMAVRSMETAEMAMEMAPGALPRPGRVPEQRLLSPEIRRRHRRSCRTLSRILPIVLGFSVGRLFIGGEAASEGHRACPLAPLRLSFGPRPSSGKNRSFNFYFVQFREYFLCSFSTTQKQQKTGNYHCGILSIG